MVHQEQIHYWFIESSIIKCEHYNDRDDQSGETLLIRGLKIRDLWQRLPLFINTFIQKPGVNINMPDSEGRSPIWHAIAAGNIHLVPSLIRYGARVDSVKPNPLIVEVIERLRTTMLLYWHYEGDQKTNTISRYAKGIQALIKAGSPIQIPGHEGKAPLHLALETAIPEIVIILLDAGAEPMEVGDLEPVHFYSEQGFKECKELITRKKNEIEQRRKDFRQIWTEHNGYVNRLPPDLVRMILPLIH